ncbi:hypothetical protein AM500_04490 [Bacillus sp. FJAT-18017]|uniref:hypothetical protein n=1 Tax=Bacillus sp. FJAT-18017 TaxID=1705566 RepID=UPI0006AF5B34|nr:hypothetical protein [Bacillus sp. FJAT-18017]ALC89131.1 hypothetical protein AM500_04490 [Bacillus sp. FJAT-18017]
MILIAILMLTNIATLSYFLEKEPKHYSYVYMSGKGPNWRVDDYVISFLPGNHFSFGGGTLSYIGSEDTPIGKTKVRFEVYDHDDTNFAGGINESEEEATSMHMGGGEGPETNPPSIREIEKWYVLIRWAGKEEKIELNIGPSLK